MKFKKPKDVVRKTVYLERKMYNKRQAELRKTGRNMSEYLREILSKPILSS